MFYLVIIDNFFITPKTLIFPFFIFPIFITEFTFFSYISKSFSENKQKNLLELQKYDNITSMQFLKNVYLAVYQLKFKMH